MALIIQKSYNESEEKWIMVLEGEVDLHTADQLKEAVNQMLSEKIEDVKILGDRLDYIDSTGLSVFISALKKLQKENKNIILKNMKPSIKKLLNITGLDKIIIME
ncbi:anti-sigma B factor antagonist [Tindallia magadiensis]|uniref:Anti-sigma factor antagonist n=1 Tax=Tindallia magadiensis TaxID=69895 RepID=A0A1I3G912_9FIRM|nr:STAS domain-containing protein [Tindallia magadiensis]SFI19943.1 anti-sigma B factor antagonist [Tindallia magadiensis]